MAPIGLWRRAGASTPVASALGARYIAAMTRFALQFGQTQSGLTYLERMSAYGICARGEANIAIVQIGKKAPYEYDLPGGGIEADEDEAAALMREFQEETGLTVWPTRVIGRAGQYWVNQGASRVIRWRHSTRLSSQPTTARRRSRTTCWFG
jgi:hypothetical protein